MDSPLMGGRLVVATPTLADPNFRRTVVGLLSHDEDGSLGVILNRPSDVPVTTVVEGWDEAVSQPPVVFLGGPVAPDTAIGLSRAPQQAGAAGWQPVVGDIGVIDLASATDADPAAFAPVRIFAGHAGWGPGQLDAEVDSGAWFVLDANPDDLLCPEPETLWRTVIVRQGGVYRSFPDDPSLN